MNILEGAAERYPANPHLTYLPFYTSMNRIAFIEGAEWARREALLEAADLMEHGDSISYLRELAEGDD